jgi:CRISPR-associated protein Cas5d
MRYTRKRETWARHKLQAIFQRRLERGQCHHTPALGWREFTCSYWGPFRGDYVVDADLNLTIPSMLITPWDHSVGGQCAHRFMQDVRIEKGVMTFAE